MSSSSDWGYEVDEVESHSRSWDVSDTCMLWTQKDTSDARSILRAPNTPQFQLIHLRTWKLSVYLASGASRIVPNEPAIVKDSWTRAAL
jgi:hypothetical protein